eukprot:5551137-Prorocentrum_lima.AAC.1
MYNTLRCHVASNGVDTSEKSTTPCGQKGALDRQWALFNSFCLEVRTRRVSYFCAKKNGEIFQF